LREIIVKIDATKTLCKNCQLCRRSGFDWYCISFVNGKTLELSKYGKPKRCKECLEAEVVKMPIRQPENILKELQNMREEYENSSSKHSKRRLR